MEVKASGEPMWGQLQDEDGEKDPARSEAYRGTPVEGEIKENRGPSLGGGRKEGDFKSILSFSISQATA